MKFNINDSIRVFITPRGEEFWREYWSILLDYGMEIPPIVRDAEGWTRIQLWQAMAIFGRGCGNGLSSPIRTEIEIPERKDAS